MPRAGQSEREGAAPPGAGDGFPTGPLAGRLLRLQLFVHGVNQSPALRLRLLDDRGHPERHGLRLLGAHEQSVVRVEVRVGEPHGEAAP
eukprot:scaffold1070_cov245-Pinguiococcus_pyrenoidosus.AAC.53